MPKPKHDDLILSALRAGKIRTDPTTGHICWADGRSAGTPQANGYLTLTLSRRSVLAHRVVWLAQYPVATDLQINHRNGRRWDNRLSNLELVTPKGNSQHAHLISYAAVGLHAEDANTVDPAWFAQVMALATKPEVTTEEIHALKASASIEDGAWSVYKQRPITRPC